MSDSQRGYALVTGASSGIGAGLARMLVEEGWPVILVARREDRLKALAADLAAWNRPVQILTADLSAPGAADTVLARCDAAGWKVGALVNNAGLGFQKALVDMDDAQVFRMVQVNMTVLTELTHRFLPGMVAARKGFVMNIASTAAFQPVPFFAVYAATKAYVVSFSEALHEELLPLGIKVIAVCPGPVSTEFQEVAGIDPRFFAKSQSVDEVVEVARRALHSGRAVVWTSTFQRVFSLLSELSPRWLRRKAAVMMLRSAMR
jgi:short-subunit dehydrogenase